MVRSSSPAVRVTVERGKAEKPDYSFTKRFKIGRDEECEVRLSDAKVSRFHAEARFEYGKWWLVDLQSTNGIFVEGRSSDRIPITDVVKVDFGQNGPLLTFEIETPEKVKGPESLSPEHYQKRYFETRPGETVGAHTMMIRSVYGQLQKKQKRKFYIVTGVLAFFLLCAGAIAFYLHILLEKQAVDSFYTFKSKELEIAGQFRKQLDDAEKKRLDAEKLEDLEKQSQAYQAELRPELEKEYNGRLKNLGIYGKKDREDSIILSIVRTFGECELAMPPDFVREVKEYIRKWKSTAKLVKAIETAKKNGYLPKIAETLQAHGLPPQFIYLALQESDFDLNACGKQTPFGIAKGMWQLIPDTARLFHLTIGPKADVCKKGEADSEDERHDFAKSTQAAAKYIRYLYETQAQASGLLVMASYNWGPGRVQRLINSVPENSLIESMPKNPKERNFWCLYSKYKDNIPQETYQYVFYIVSAAVIGEDPRLFGFDFDNPLSRAMK